MHRLCAGLERLGLPRVFVVQLLFLYRYIFVIADEALRMRRGMELRSIGGRSPKLRVYGSLVGHLLLRAMDRAQRIYGAMLARGFSGDMPTLQPACPHGSDIVFVTGWLSFFVLARCWNLADSLGRLFCGGLP
jgi:cobalt/nickel transport system permease protein